MEKLDLLHSPFPVHVLKRNRSVAHFSLSDVTDKFLSMIHCCRWQDDEVPDNATVLALGCVTESMFSDDR